MRTFWLGLVAMLLVVGLTAAQDTTNMQKHEGMVMQKHEGMMQKGMHGQQKMITPDQLQWTNARPDRPEGIQWAALEGNPQKGGKVTMFIKYPANMKFQPHSFTNEGHITVIDGELHLGFGKTFDESKGTTLPKMSHVVIPANTPHYMWTDTETIVQLEGTGASKIKYVNASDNPMNKSTAKTPKEKNDKDKDKE